MAKFDDSHDYDCRCHHCAEGDFDDLTMCRLGYTIQKGEGSEKSQASSPLSTIATAINNVYTLSSQHYKINYMEKEGSRNKIQVFIRVRPLINIEVNTEEVVEVQSDVGCSLCRTKQLECPMIHTANWR